MIFLPFFAIVLGLAPAVAAPRPLTHAGCERGRVQASGKPAQAANVKAQVLLDRAGFSPGAIDGRASDNFENALRAFQKKNALGETGKLDKETWEKLAQSAEPALIEYTITANDVKGPFADEIPAKYEDKAKLKRLDYTERRRDAGGALPHGREVSRGAQSRQGFRQGRHGDCRCEHQRETGRAAETAGSKAAKIEADKGNNVVRVLAKDGALIACYPASIGSDDKPAPSGTLKVVRVAKGPTYTYDPAFKFKGVKADGKLHIAAGPNNPVGSVWIALDQKTYGIHGTSEPSKVGKVDSHGCVRMTNWDALALAAMVRKGTVVVFID